MLGKVLITGGAGFIGSHLTDFLISKNCAVRCYDTLQEQVHGLTKVPPAYMNPETEFILSDVTNESKPAKCLEGVDYVVDFAACVGRSKQSCHFV